MIHSYPHSACYCGPLSFILICFILYYSPYMLAKPAQSTVVVSFIVTKYVEVSFHSVEIGIHIGE